MGGLKAGLLMGGYAVTVLALLGTVGSDPAIIFSVVFGMLGFILALVSAMKSAPAAPAFPQGHIRDYDPTGRYTYKDQNPVWK